MVTRLCCGRDHGGPVCPDGMVMCCLCFSRFGEADLYVDADGSRWDVCNPCRASEQQRARERRDHLGWITERELAAEPEAQQRHGGREQQLKGTGRQQPPADHDPNCP